MRRLPGPDPLTKLRTAGRSVVAAAANPIRVDDPLVAVQDATRRHRREHKCGAYTYGDGSLPATLVAAVGARRVIEVGTALGYTALSMATAAADAHVETIEVDADHVRLAREQIAALRMSDRVTVLPGDATEILRALPSNAYDAAFFDGFTPTIDVICEFHRLLRPGGLLIAGNLILRPRRAVTEHIADPSLWQTHCLGETALCVKVDPGRRSTAGATELAIACTLDGSEWRGRLDEWGAVLDLATHAIAIPRGRRLEFGADAPVAEIARLARAEHECCRFLAFAMTVDDRGVGLEIAGPPDAQPVIAALFAAPGASWGDE